MIRRRVVVRGHVQGVGFRYTARRLAAQRNVSGWIANCRDGSVEAVFEGSPTDVELLVDWCRNGPRGADVDNVDVSDEEPESLSGFSVR